MQNLNYIILQMIRYRFSLNDVSKDIPQATIIHLNDRDVKGCEFIVKQNFQIRLSSNFHKINTFYSEGKPH